MTVILFFNSTKLHFRYSNQKLNSSNKLCLFRKCNKFHATKFSCWNLCAAAAAGLSPIYDNNSALGRVLKHWLANLIELLPCYSFLLLFFSLFPPFFLLFCNWTKCFQIENCFPATWRGFIRTAQKKQQQCQHKQQQQQQLQNTFRSSPAARFVTIFLLAAVLFLLYLIKICCSLSFGQGRKRGGKGSGSGKRMEREIRTQTHKNVVTFGAHKFQLIAFCI